MRDPARAIPFHLGALGQVLLSVRAPDDARFGRPRTLALSA